MIDAFIFSKDRACQLDLLLQSLATNLPGVFRPYVLWKASSGEYRQGYAKCFDRFPAGNWVEEKDGPRLDMRRACERILCGANTLIGIFTDDCIAWRKTNIDEGDIRDVFRNEQILMASLRLGFNTTVQNYVTGELQPRLETAEPFKLSRTRDESEGFVSWEYERFDYNLNFGYIGGMDACIYRASDVIQWLDQMTGMQTFRDWEGALHLPQNRRRIAKARPLMACPRTSCVVNVPTNSVQVDPTLSGTAFPRSVEELNTRYLAGERISLASIPFGDVDSCHREYPLEMEQP